jgi:bacterial leucyl aminopeptidase
MRIAPLLLILGCSSPSSTRIISIDSDAVPLAMASEHGSKLVAERGDLAILEVDEADLQSLSERMHEEHHRCGGFMVHDSLAEAEAAPLAERKIDYTIDKPDEVRAVLGRLDQSKILQTIRELSSRKNRYYLSESGAATSVWLRDRWKSFTTRSDVTVELFDHGYPQKSVIMTIPGTTRASEVVVIGGHLDSIGPGGKSADAPGADDDASGIATLSEVARVLLASDFRPERTIMFMAYAAEEVGLRGSLSIAKELGKRKINVVGALQLDMTNYQGSDADIWLISDYTSNAQNKFVSHLIERYTDATWAWDKCGYACSDHASWHRAGVPASMPFESRFRDSNRNIHTHRDTLEVSDNNAAHAIKFARLGGAYAVELAKGSLSTTSTTATTDEPGSSSNRLWWALGLLGIGLVIWRMRAR